MPINRFHAERTATAGITSIDNSTEIDIREFAGGGIAVGTLSNQTTLSYYVASEPGGTYYELCDREGVAVTQAIDDGQAYPLPDELYGFGAFKVLADNTALQVTVSLKG
jgi:hypothetical protein